MSGELNVERLHRKPKAGSRIWRTRFQSMGSSEIRRSVTKTGSAPLLPSVTGRDLVANPYSVEEVN
jgi:hypothetical protein